MTRVYGREYIMKGEGEKVSDCAAERENVGKIKEERRLLQKNE